MAFDPTAIEPDCTFPVDDKGKWDLYFSLLRTTVSSLLKEYPDTQTAIRALPIVNADTLSPSMHTFSIYILAHAQYTQGSGRFITDALNTYLIPGKYTPILLSRSARFVLREAKNTPLFFIEYLIQFPSKSDFEILKINLPKLLRNIRLSLLSTRYSRRLIQKRKISTIERELIAHENIQDLFELSNKKVNSPFISHIPKRFFDELYNKENSQIPTALQTPFKRSIFLEVHRLISLLPPSIQQSYSQKLLIRMLSFGYLFRKVISYAEFKHAVPNLLFKLFPIPEHGQHTYRCGLLFVIQLQEKTSRFDHQRLFKVCQKILPFLRKNPERTFIDARNDSSCKTIYIEFSKEHHLSFTQQDFTKLKNELIKEVEFYFQTMDKQNEIIIGGMSKDFIGKLQSELIEKGRYNDLLLSRLIHSFTSSSQINENWIDAVSRSYYMLYTLLEESAATTPFLTAAQTVEDVFIVTVLTENTEIHSMITSILLQERQLMKYARFDSKLNEEENGTDINTIGFQFEATYLSVLYYQYRDAHQLKKFRSHFLDQLQRLQVKIEASSIIRS